MNICKVLTAVFWILFVAARLFQPKTCNHVNTMSNFDREQYLGIWYHLKRNADQPLETGQCFTTQIVDVTGSGEKYTGENGQYYGFESGNTSDYKAGPAVPLYWNNLFSGVYTIHWGPGYGSVYKVLDTDYTNYSVYYSCTGFFGTGLVVLETVWITARTKVEAASA